MESITTLGYKGKQVRDQIHSTDVISAFAEFAKAPRPGEVYNLGGGRGNSASILECIEKIDALLRSKLSWEYVDQPRAGDHICYISNLAKFTSHYPDWRLTLTLDQIIERLIKAMP